MAKYCKEVAPKIAAHCKSAMERHYLATLNARLQAEHCPSIFELAALVEFVDSEMRGLDLGAGVDRASSRSFMAASSGRG